MRKPPVRSIHGSSGAGRARPGWSPQKIPAATPVCERGLAARYVQQKTVASPAAEIGILSTRISAGYSERGRLTVACRPARGVSRQQAIAEATRSIRHWRTKVDAVPSAADHEITVSALRVMQRVKNPLKLARFPGTNQLQLGGLPRPALDDQISTDPERWHARTGPGCDHRGRGPLRQPRNSPSKDSGNSIPPRPRPILHLPIRAEARCAPGDMTATRSRCRFCRFSPIGPRPRSPLPEGGAVRHLRHRPGIGP